MAAALQSLGLTLAEADLFPAAAPLAPSPEFAARLRRGTNLAVAQNTEKARSEFIVAPILFETLERLGGGFGLFSGVSFDVDPERGLTGFCDYILTRSPMQRLLSRPILAIGEVKNDSVQAGLGQCVAAMVAAQQFNAAPPSPVYGASTTGAIWQFARLDGTTLTLDTAERHVTELDTLLGILAAILRGG